jgi:hypothetical protein
MRICFKPSDVAKEICLDVTGRIAFYDRYVYVINSYQAQKVVQEFGARDFLIRISNRTYP